MISNIYKTDMALKLKRCSALCLVASLLLFFFAMYAQNKNRQYVSAVNSIYFQNGVVEGNQITGERFDIVSFEKIEEYNEAYLKTSSKYFKGKLEKNKNLEIAYEAFIYAFEKSYNTVCFPKDTFEYGDLTKVLTFVMCDNPMLEMNTEANTNEFQYDFETIEDITLYSFFFPTHDKNHYDKKLYAYEKAQEIVNNIPAEIKTESERAFYLYDYIASSVKYNTNVNYNNKQPNYLYDAFVRRRTNCDGFSKAIAMLYNLAGIECFNVFYTQADTGHTWNVAKIDGVYYNLDATNDSSIYSFTKDSDDYCYYRISDERIGTLLNAQIMNSAPICSDKTHDYDNIDIFVDDGFLLKTKEYILKKCIDEFTAGNPNITVYSDDLKNMTYNEKVKLAKSIFEDNKRISVKMWHVDGEGFFGFCDAKR